jgi:hypothetical protein
MTKRFSRKGEMYIPTKDNDGRKITSNATDAILMWIYGVFDGYTDDGVCERVCRMADGSMAKNEFLTVWVAMNAGHVDKFENLAARLAFMLGQESLSTKVTKSDIEMIEPSNEQKMAYRSQRTVRSDELSGAA